MARWHHKGGANAQLSYSFYSFLYRVGRWWLLGREGLVVSHLEPHREQRGGRSHEGKEYTSYFCLKQQSNNKRKLIFLAAILFEFLGALRFFMNESWQQFFHC